MDGFEANEGVVIIAASNRPDVLNSVRLHPERFWKRNHVSKASTRYQRQRAGCKRLSTVVRKGEVGRSPACRRGRAMVEERE